MITHTHLHTLSSGGWTELSIVSFELVSRAVHRGHNKPWTCLSLFLSLCVLPTPYIVYMAVFKAGLHGDGVTPAAVLQ